MKNSSSQSSTASTAGAKISLEKAKEMIGAYRAKLLAVPTTTPRGLQAIASLKIKAEYLRDLTSRQECVYVRFFLAQQPHIPGVPAPRTMLDDQTMVLVGVDANGKNLVQYGLYEDLGVCPTGCHDPGGDSI